MSQNFVEWGWKYPFLASSVVVPQASAGIPKAGDPFVVGFIKGCMETQATLSTDTVVGWLRGIVKINVEAKDGAGNSAVALGDKLYIDSGAGAHQAVVNKNATLVPYGTALGVVTSGATAQIEVLL